MERKSTHMKYLRMFEGSKKEKGNEFNMILLFMYRFLKYMYVRNIYQ